jgi:hypothetical protein
MAGKAKHTEADKDAGRAAIGALRSVVPENYDCVVVLRNTKTNALMVVGNVDSVRETRLLEAAANSREVGAFKIPEPH